MTSPECCEGLWELGSEPGTGAHDGSGAEAPRGVEAPSGVVRFPNCHEAGSKWVGEPDYNWGGSTKWGVSTVRNASYFRKKYAFSGFEV